MTSSGGGGSSLPSTMTIGMGALPTPATTPLWHEDAPVIQSMMIVQPRVLAPWPPIGHSFEQRCTPQEGQRAHAHAWQPRTE
jgi:hypothetical protein